MARISVPSWDGYLGAGDKNTVLFRDVHAYHHFAQKPNWFEVVSEHKSLESSRAQEVQTATFKMCITIWQALCCVIKTKPPIDLFQLPHRKNSHTCACLHTHTYTQSDFKPRNYATTQCCIHYNKAKTHHMAQFTWNFAVSWHRTVKLKGEEPGFETELPVSQWCDLGQEQQSQQQATLSAVVPGLRRERLQDSPSISKSKLLTEHGVEQRIQSALCILGFPVSDQSEKRSLFTWPRQSHKIM